jgi:hypothetical protein
MAYAVASKKNDTTYYLHAQESMLRGGKRAMRFFMMETILSDGYTVAESAQTALLLLKRKEA